MRLRASSTRRSDSGVTFFDNAWEYHDGRSEEWLGQAPEPGPEWRARLC